MDHRPACLGVLICTVLCSCTGIQYRSQYPLLPRVTDRDPGLSCASLDDEILRANALRDAIYEEYSDVLDEEEIEAWDVIRDVQRDPKDAFIDAIFRELRSQERSGQYMQAAAAAGQRLEQLLTYKDERTCTTGPTNDSSLTDTIILENLLSIREQLRAGELTSDEYASQRRNLLDMLR